LRSGKGGQQNDRRDGHDDLYHSTHRGSPSVKTKWLEDDGVVYPNELSGFNVF
jgi:hypothetical protein